MTNSSVDFLHSRRSIKFVQEPAPSNDELAQILQSAMSAPDHGRLRPWRFKLIRGQAIQKLADLAIQATKDEGPGLAPDKEAGTRRWLENAPLLIAVACYMDHSNTKIPENERMLATGAAVTNILNASHMLGYSAYWSTGLGTYIDSVNEALGFDPLEYRFMGYVSIGTPIRELSPPERPSYTDFVSEWEGA